MSRARQRYLALLVLVLALAVIVLPGIGDAQDATPDAAAPDAAVIEQGEALFNRTCIACHQAGGTGVDDRPLAGYPALAGNPLVTLEDPTVLVQTLITGRAGMPNFRGLSDEEIAAVASYVRQAWGNSAGPVDPALVAEVRAEYSDVEGIPDATPIASEFPGESLASEDTASTAETPADSEDATESTPAAEGGSDPGGITPVPTIGQ